MKTVFLHGLDSSPGGTKAVLLKKRYPDIVIPELPPDVDRRVRIIEKLFTGPVFLIGSSLGGLTALLYALKYPEMVEGMVLLAPAVRVSDESILTREQIMALDSIFVPAGIRTVVIAGTKDEVIPLSGIRAMVERSPERSLVTLHEVDDDHNLHNHLDFMVSCIDRELSGFRAD